MNQTLVTRKNHSVQYRRGRSDFRGSTAAQPPERHPKLIDILRPPIINRCYPDWFAQRIWEDDGGGQAQLS